MSNLQPKQFTHTVEQKDGGWSGSVTPFAATSAAHAKAMIEKSETHKVTTGSTEATRATRASVAGKGMAGRMLQGMQKTQRQSFRD